MAKVTLTRDEVLAFLKERNVEEGCPSCGRNDWTAVDDQNGLVPIVPLQAPEGTITIPSPSIPTVMLICNNCFYMRMHARVPILNWAKKKRAQ